MRTVKLRARSQPTAACLVFLVAVGAARADAQISEDALNLVVKVQAFREGAGTPTQGTGFVVGVSAGRIFIATAGHVVNGAYGEAEENGVRRRTVGEVRVAFRGDLKKAPADLPIARIERWANDDTLDLALISVAARSAGSRYARFKLDRRGSADKGDIVFPVGCGVVGPGCDRVPPPEVVALHEANFMSYFTNVTSRGHSGGPLFNRWGEIVGMVVQQERTTLANAEDIGFVLDHLKSWGFDRQVQLRRPFVPRGGPGWTLSLTPLWASGQAPILSPDGAPMEALAKSPGISGRAALSRRIFATLLAPSVLAMASGHVSAVRLAPRNLLIGAGMVGIEGTIRWSALAASVFGELGFGHVESQFDAGGHFVTGADGSTVYVPFWNAVKADGAGGGFGGRVQVNVLRWLVIEGSVVRYDFNLPENAQALPDVFFGAGVRVGA